MFKKSLLALLLATIIAAGVFGQTDFNSMAKNTLTVDLGPTIVGLAISKVGSLINDVEQGASSAGFGIGAQYERQLSQRFSAAARFAYLKGGLGYTSEEIDGGITVKGTLDLNLSSFSVEGHVRYYPFAETFFLDGMAGYANMSAGFSGSYIGRDSAGRIEQESVSFTGKRNFFKFGGKVGWRICFGKNGGFTFEPAVGYYGGAGFGDTFGKQLSKKIEIIDIDIDEVDKAFSMVEKFVFVGGPRVTLSFGWRF